MISILYYACSFGDHYKDHSAVAGKGYTCCSAYILTQEGGGNGIIDIYCIRPYVQVNAFCATVRIVKKERGVGLLMEKICLQKIKNKDAFRICCPENTSQVTNR